MADTFTPPKPPSVSALSLENTAGVRRAEFEGGYAQRSSVGPNPIDQTASLSFRNLTDAERDVVVSFFEERRGVTPFYYQVPGTSAPKLWTCANWRVTPARNKVDWMVTASLQIEFDVL